MIAHATTVTFTASIVQAPHIKSAAKVQLLLGGIRRDSKHSMAFYQPAVALGKMAGKISRLGTGIGLTGSGTLLEEQGQLWVLISEVSQLSAAPQRLHRDLRGGVLLKEAEMNIRTRGMIIRTPRLRKLEDLSGVTNTTLGLTPQADKNQEVRPGLLPLELAFYGEQAEAAAQLQMRRYVSAKGQLQRRRLNETVISRIEVGHFELLHEEQALI